eukprot:TRINITY_DN15479_c0_g1_i1.p1 TRINITY_DN15479_c0_g1~~TRINITY_DN15479_c0_g1_i1.p1  ORF type:complete len:190 (-),score=23.53 TRINITY_DN15479_c0_g1_i1:406-975(-)
MGDSLSLPSERGPIFGFSEWSTEQEVFLAVTALSPAVAEEIGAPVAYHSSIIVDKIEYTFAHSGIVACEGCQSHAHLAGPGVILPMGKSVCSGKAMQDALANYFQPRSYDFLIKNCNHFSDCALFYLLGERLPCKYMAAEQLAGLMPTTMIQLLIRMLGLGEYRQNPLAMGFDARFVQKFVGSPVGSTC